MKLPKTEPVIRRVYITKYALTVGLFTQMAQQHISEHADKKGNLPVYWRGLDRFPGFFREGQDAFLTESEARLRVQEMAQNKGESLRKSLAKVEALASKGYKTMPIEEKPDPRIT